MKETTIWKGRTYFYVICILLALIAWSLKAVAVDIYRYQINHEEAFWPPDVVPHPHPPQPEPNDDDEMAQL